MEKLKPVPEGVLMTAYGYQKRTVAVHGEDGSVLKRDVIRPDKRARLSIAALRETKKVLEAEGIPGFDNFVVSGGRIAGEDHPDIASVDAEELTRKLHLKPEQINVRPFLKTGKEVKETSGEIDALGEVAAEKGLENVIVVANLIHTFSIRRQLKKFLPQARVFSAEEILTNLPDERKAKRYKKVIRKMHWSLDSLQFVVHESLKNAILTLPNGNKILRDKAQRMERRTKV